MLTRVLARGKTFVSLQCLGTARRPLPRTPQGLNLQGLLRRQATLVLFLGLAMNVTV